jgi:hypothetical protein
VSVEIVTADSLLILPSRLDELPVVMCGPARVRTGHVAMPVGVLVLALVSMAPRLLVVVSGHVVMECDVAMRRAREVVRHGCSLDTSRVATIGPR